MTNLAFQIETSKRQLEKGSDCLLQSHLTILKGELALMYVERLTDRLIYRFPTERLADSSIVWFEKIIAKKELKLEVFRPQLSKNLVVRGKVCHDL